MDPRAVELVDEIDYPFADRFGSGEGGLAQFWRVDAGRVRWVTVDLPEAIDVRERLLPRGDRQSLVVGSSLDESWMDAVDPSHGVLITAQGLLMYFEFENVERLLAACARRFPGAAIVFDAVARWMSEASRKGRLGRPDGSQPPPWLGGMDGDKRRPRGRGVFFGFLAPLAAKLTPLRRLLFTIQRRRF